jgi:polysaccharide export outer membrane protein
MQVFRHLVAIALLVPPVLPASAADEAAYRLNPGDVLRLSVWREETLDRQAVIQPDGTVSFPLVGQVPAAGRTPEEVQETIAGRIEVYIPDPVVTVELLEARGNRIYVLGEVARPGEYQLGRPITVVQAISLAGGFTPFAGSGEVRILRTTGGVEESIPFDYGDVADGADIAANIELKAGDTVIVPGGSLF